MGLFIGVGVKVTNLVSGEAAVDGTRVILYLIVLMPPPRISKGCDAEFEGLAPGAEALLELVEEPIHFRQTMLKVTQGRPVDGLAPVN